MYSLGHLGTGNQGRAFLGVEDSASDSKMVQTELESFFLGSMYSRKGKKWTRGLAVAECSLKRKARVYKRGTLWTRSPETRIRTPSSASMNGSLNSFQSFY